MTLSEPSDQPGTGAVNPVPVQRTRDPAGRPLADTPAGLLASGADRESGPGRPQRVRIAGVPVDLCNSAEFVALTVAWARDGARASVVGVNAHVVNVCARDPDFAAAVAASQLLLPDGQSIVWAARFAGHQPRGRVPLTHLTAELCQAWAAAGLRVYLLGGRPGIAERAGTRLAAAYGVLVVGSHHGYFDDADNDRVVEAINATGADILVVGLGNPKQELWLHANRPRLTPPVALTCGGWLDWTAGERRPCPPWLYRCGLEWAYRLGQEPRRLFGRYVLGNPVFVARVVRARSADRRAARASARITTVPDQRQVVDERDPATR